MNPISLLRFYLYLALKARVSKNNHTIALLVRSVRISPIIDIQSDLRPPPTRALQLRLIKCITTSGCVTHRGPELFHRARCPLLQTTTGAMSSTRSGAMERLHEWLARGGTPLSVADGVAMESTAVHDPATGQTLACFRETSADELDGIIAAASAAQTKWNVVPPLERSKVGWSIALSVFTSSTGVNNDDHCCSRFLPLSLVII